MLYELQLAWPHLPTNADISETSPASLDQLAGQRRHTSTVTEPLSDSVLQYTLRKLNHDNQSPSSISGVDGLTRLVEENFANVPAILGRETSDVEDPLASAEARPSGELNTQASTAAIPAVVGVNFFHQPNNPSEWWAYDVDNLQQPAFWGENLFDTNWGI